MKCQSPFSGEKKIKKNINLPPAEFAQGVVKVNMEWISDENKNNIKEQNKIKLQYVHIYCFLYKYSNLSSFIIFFTKYYPCNKRTREKEKLTIDNHI